MRHSHRISRPLSRFIFRVRFFTSTVPENLPCTELYGRALSLIMFFAGAVSHVTNTQPHSGATRSPRLSSLLRGSLGPAPAVSHAWVNPPSREKTPKRVFPQLDPSAWTSRREKAKPLEASSPIKLDY